MFSIVNHGHKIRDTTRIQLDTRRTIDEGIMMRTTGAPLPADDTQPLVLTTDLTKALLEEDATDAESIDDGSSAPSRTWIQSLVYGQARADSGAIPPLMSTGFMYTLRDDSAMTLWLTLDGREDDEIDERADRHIRVQDDRQINRNNVFNRNGAVPSTPDDSERFASVMPRLNVLWLLVACGYMVPFTSIGSLIAYFKYAYGPEFYVQLYCAFYLPGWPISELQRYFDESFDRKFGSSNTFLARVSVGSAVQGAVLLLLTALPSWTNSNLGIEKAVTIVLMVFMGCASWMCHGTACQLCGLFPPSSVAFLQTGFRTPEVYSVVMVATLALDDHASQAHVNLYYWCTALMVCIGGFAWVALVMSPPAQHYFTLKDLAQPSENRWQNSTKIDAQHHSLPRTDIEVDSSGRSASSSNSSSGSNHNRTDSSDSSSWNSTSSGGDMVTQELPPTNSSSKCTSIDGKQRYRPVSSEVLTSIEEATSSSFSVKDEPVDDPTLAVKKAVFNCRLALFLNIWSSIFVGAFFAYCPTDKMPLLGSLGGPVFEDVSVVLYFTRLFSDLIGRPLSAILCPKFLGTEGSLVPACVLRLLLAVAFFVYIWPTQPLPPSNLFVLTVVSVFSALSGILCVRSYEIAAAKMSTKIDQARAVSLMNTTFQAACFSAVVMGVAISETGFFVESLDSSSSSN